MMLRPPSLQPQACVHMEGWMCKEFVDEKKCEYVGIHERVRPLSSWMASSEKSSASNESSLSRKFSCPMTKVSAAWHISSGSLDFAGKELKSWRWDNLDGLGYWKTLWWECISFFVLIISFFRLFFRPFFHVCFVLSFFLSFFLCFFLFFPLYFCFSLFLFLLCFLSFFLSFCLSFFLSLWKLL